MLPILFDTGSDQFVGRHSLTEQQREDARSAVAHARVTGSVGCTYNGVQASRLYTSSGYPTYRATDLWLIALSDDRQPTHH
jgi:hypothetical protein